MWRVGEHGRLSKEIRKPILEGDRESHVLFYSGSVGDLVPFTIVLLGKNRLFPQWVLFSLIEKYQLPSNFANSITRFVRYLSSTPNSAYQNITGVPNSRDRL
jgi:hypothetical protein